MKPETTRITVELPLSVAAELEQIAKARSPFGTVAGPMKQIAARQGF